MSQKGAEVTIFARDADKFKAAAKPIRAASYDGFDIVINATPLGTAGARESETAATAAPAAGARLAYDIVYNPMETRFLREAREAGCELIGGLEMLVSQAMEQFRIWTEGDAPEEVMREAAVRALRRRQFE